MDKGENRFLLKSDSEKPLGESVVQLIREAIYSGYLLPGTRLIEAELSEKMNVSRTPLREAIRQLQAEGLIKVVPNKGATVVSYSGKDIEEIYRISAVLEGVAASLAVDNMGSSELGMIKDLQDKMKTKELQAKTRKWFLTNRELQSVYLKCCDTTRLVKLIEQQINKVDRYWFVLLSIPGLMEKSINQHGEIIEAFEREERDSVRKLVEDHIFSSGLMLTRHLESLPPSVF